MKNPAEVSLGGIMLRTRDYGVAIVALTTFAM